MRIVHFNNTGMVASVIADFLNDIGHESLVFSPLPKGLEYIYEGLPIVELVRDNFEDHFVELIDIMIDADKIPDIIHVHGHPQWSFIDLCKPLREDFGIKFVYTGHGTDVRFHWHDSIFYGYEARTYVTRDLEHPQAQYIPNAPHPKWFSRKHDFIPNTALRKKVLPQHKLDNMYNFEQSEKVSKEMGLTLFTQEYIEIPYIEFSRHLEKFEYFFDYKRLLMEWKHRLTYAPLDLPFSLTALEMLLLGGKVFRGNKIYTELPEEHYYGHVMHQYLELYEEVLQ